MHDFTEYSSKAFQFASSALQTTNNIESQPINITSRLLTFSAYLVKKSLRLTDLYIIELIHDGGIIQTVCISSLIIFTTVKELQKGLSFKLTDNLARL